jgi:hypothetical protein
MGATAACSDRALLRPLLFALLFALLWRELLFALLFLELSTLLLPTLLVLGVSSSEATTPDRELAETRPGSLLCESLRGNGENEEESIPCCGWSFCA